MRLCTINNKTLVIKKKCLNISYPAHSAIEDVKSLQFFFLCKTVIFFYNVDVYSLKYHTLESYSEVFKNCFYIKTSKFITCKTWCCFWTHQDDIQAEFEVKPSGAGLSKLERLIYFEAGFVYHFLRNQLDRIDSTSST